MRHVFKSAEKLFKRMLLTNVYRCFQSNHILPFVGIEKLYVRSYQRNYKTNKIQ